MPGVGDIPEGARRVPVERRGSLRRGDRDLPGELCIRGQDCLYRLGRGVPRRSEWPPPLPGATAHRSCSRAETVSIVLSPTRSPGWIPRIVVFGGPATVSDTVLKTLATWGAGHAGFGADRWGRRRSSRAVTMRRERARHTSRPVWSGPMRSPPRRGGRTGGPVLLVSATGSPDSIAAETAPAGTEAHRRARRDLDDPAVRSRRLSPASPVGPSSGGMVLIGMPCPPSSLSAPFRVAPMSCSSRPGWCSPIRWPGRGRRVDAGAVASRPH